MKHSSQLSKSARRQIRKRKMLKKFIRNNRLDHNERRRHEVFNGNYTPGGFDRICFRSKRIGETSYDVNGKVVHGLWPMFVNASEYKENLEDLIARYAHLPDQGVKFQESLDDVERLKKKPIGRN